MDDATTVCIFHRVADGDEASQKTAQLNPALALRLLRTVMKTFDGVFERFAADEAHRVVGAPICTTSQRVHRNDAGMLQSARDLGFKQKTRTTVGVIGMPLKDPFECDVAI